MAFLEPLPTDYENDTAATDEHPAAHNDANTAINAIADVLGADPAGDDSTITARFATVEASIALKATTAALAAVTTELGTNPSGGEATVVARFDAVDTALAARVLTTTHDALVALIGSNPQGGETTVADRLTAIEADVVLKAAQAELDAIADALGANPEGAYADAAARLTAIEAAVALKATTAALTVISDALGDDVTGEYDTVTERLTAHETVLSRLTAETPNEWKPGLIGGGGTSAVAVDPNNPQNFLIGTDTGGVRIVTGGGQHPEQSRVHQRGIPNFQARKIAGLWLSLVEPGTALAAVGNGTADSGGLYACKRVFTKEPSAWVRLDGGDFEDLIFNGGNHLAGVKDPVTTPYPRPYGAILAVDERAEPDAITTTSVPVSGSTVVVSTASFFVDGDVGRHLRIGSSLVTITEVTDATTVEVDGIIVSADQVAGVRVTMLGLLFITACTTTDGAWQLTVVRDSLTTIACDQIVGTAGTPIRGAVITETALRQVTADRDTVLLIPFDQSQNPSATRVMTTKDTSNIVGVGPSATAFSTAPGNCLDLAYIYPRSLGAKRTGIVSTGHRTATVAATTAVRTTGSLAVDLVVNEARFTAADVGRMVKIGGSSASLETTKQGTILAVASPTACTVGFVAVSKTGLTVSSVDPDNITVTVTGGTVTTAHVGLFVNIGGTSTRIATRVSSTKFTTAAAVAAPDQVAATPITIFDFAVGSVVTIYDSAILTTTGPTNVYSSGSTKWQPVSGPVAAVTTTGTTGTTVVTSTDVFTSAQVGRTIRVGQVVTTIVTKVSATTVTVADSVGTPTNGTSVVIAPLVDTYVFGAGSGTSGASVTLPTGCSALFGVNHVGRTVTVGSTETVITAVASDGQSFTTEDAHGGTHGSKVVVDAASWMAAPDYRTQWQALRVTETTPGFIELWVGGNNQPVELRAGGTSDIKDVASMWVGVAPVTEVGAMTWTPVTRAGFGTVHHDGTRYWLAGLAALPSNDSSASISRFGRSHEATSQGVAVSRSIPMLTDDGGRSWKPAKIIGNVGCLALVADPLRPEAFYIGTSDYPLTHIDDDMRSKAVFNPASNIMTLGTTAFADPVTGEILFGGPYTSGAKFANVHTLYGRDDPAEEPLNGDYTAWGDYNLATGAGANASVAAVMGGAVVYDSANRRHLIVATNGGGGVWYTIDPTRDAPNTWTRATPGWNTGPHSTTTSTSRLRASVAANHTTKHVFVADPFTGIWRAPVSNGVGTFVKIAGFVLGVSSNLVDGYGYMTYDEDNDVLVFGTATGLYAIEAATTVNATTALANATLIACGAASLAPGRVPGSTIYDPLSDCFWLATFGADADEVLLVDDDDEPLGGELWKLSRSSLGVWTAEDHTTPTYRNAAVWPEQMAKSGTRLLVTLTGSSCLILDGV
jgi:hypothetical protein